jgi:hypothetical protein
VTSRISGLLQKKTFFCLVKKTFLFLFFLFKKKEKRKLIDWLFTWKGLSVAGLDCAQHLLNSSIYNRFTCYRRSGVLGTGLSVACTGVLDGFACCHASSKLSSSQLTDFPGVQRLPSEQGSGAQPQDPKRAWTRCCGQICRDYSYGLHWPCWLWQGQRLSRRDDGGMAQLVGSARPQRIHYPEK